jgi:PAS domain S-box-containing protein
MMYRSPPPDASGPASPAPDATTAPDASEAELRALVRAVSDVVLVLDREGRYLKVADSAIGKLYRSPPELLGRSLHDIFPRDRADGFLGLIREALDRGEPVDAEYELELPTGTYWFASTIVPMDDDRVVWLARDITARRRADETLRRQALVFETIYDGVMLMGLDGRILDWNAGAERIYGFTREEMLGRTPVVLQHPDLEGRLEPEINEAVLARGRWEGEVPFVRRDGREGVADVVVVLQHDELGKAVGLLGVNRDITERKRVEEALRQSEEHLRHVQKMEAVGQLAGGVAHDFNNLLTAISTSAELALASLPRDSSARDDLAEIREAAHRAARLTTQLLAFSRKQVLQPRVLDMNLVVGEAERMLRRVLPVDVALLAALDPAVGCVRADPGQLEQVLMNLVVNARDAMPSGGAIVIETAALDLDAPDATRAPGLPPGRWIVLRVRDTGVGMDAATRARIFEPFFTTKEAGKGTGLGLSTVYGIVEQSGGMVQVDSTPGEGSVFHVYLPRAEEELSPDGDEPAITLPGGHETVLLAEDEAGVRASVRRILEKHGYEVHEASNGVQALRVRDELEGKLDLLLTDVVMPEMGGFELASRLRARHPGLKVLLMSGYPDGAGFAPPLGAAFLGKPFTAESLVRRVRELLDARE